MEAKGKKSASRQAGEEDPIWTREKFPECQDLQLSPRPAEGILSSSQLRQQPIIRVKIGIRIIRWSTKEVLVV